MEFLAALTIFGSVVWAIIFFVAFLALCFYSEAITNGFVAFFGLVILTVVIWFFGSDAWSTTLSYFTLYNILVYLGIGVGFSGMRSYFFGRKRARRFEKEYTVYGHEIQLTTEEKELPKKERDALVETKKEKVWEKAKKSGLKEILRDIAGNVARWLFMWPISALSWALTDLFKEFWDLVWHKGLKHIYITLVTWGFNSVINEKPKK